MHAASTRFDSPYGPIDVSWRLHGERFELTARVPFGVTAEVELPGRADRLTVGAGRHELHSDIRTLELRKTT